MTEGPVPHIFDSETLRARLRDHNVVVFQITSGLVQSGVLALAAVVLIDIFYAGRDQAVLLSLWLGAFVFAVLAFQRQLYLPVATRLRTYAVSLSAESDAYARTLLADPAFLEWERRVLAEVRTIFSRAPFDAVFPGTDRAPAP